MVLEIGLLVVAVGLSLLAQQMLKPKAGTPIRDDKPTTLSERGSFTGLCIGRREVGAVIGWAGDRKIKKERVNGGGKGSARSPKQRVYYESAWHQLPVGPGWKLWRVRQNGKSIFEGPVSRESHPSGSFVDLGNEGGFFLFWGEEDQPINEFLASEDRDPQIKVGALFVRSRWPFMMYLVWVDKRLGQGPNWPLLTYEIETRPIDSGLAQSPQFLESTRTPSGNVYQIAIITDGPPSTVRINEDRADEFKAGGWARIAGNAAAVNGDYPIASVVVSTVATVTFTTITFAQPFVGSTPSTGTLEAYLLLEDDGANPAHVLYQLMFATYPHGLGLSTEDFDLDSLEQVGQLAATEKLTCNFVVTDGEKGLTVLARALEDMGVFISWVPSLSKYQFVVIREPVSAPSLSADLILDPLPEIAITHAKTGPDKVVYTFADRKRNYRPNTINIDDDGQSEANRRWNIKPVQLMLPTDEETAQLIARRRSQEEFGRTALYKIPASRAARLMVPGKAFVADGLPYTMRLLSVHPSPYTGRVELMAAVDTYGVPAETFRREPPSGDEGEGPDVKRDPVVTVLEFPMDLDIGELTVVVTRVRGGPDVGFADIHISVDGTNYINVGRTFDVQTGGTLTSALNTIDPWLMEVGPTCTELGPDFLDVVRDYDGDHVNWGAGRQVMIIEDEVIFVRSTTALGGGAFQLNGLLRGRFGSVKAAHAIGTKFTLFDVDSIFVVRDLLLAPGLTLYVKAQPFAGGGVPLSQIEPVTRFLIGDGLRPGPVSSLRTDTRRNTWPLGGDLTLRWCYRVGARMKTGSGLQGAGRPVGRSPVVGQFTIEFENPDNFEVVIKEVGTNNEFVYTAADMAADFSSTPTQLYARVRHVNAGYASAPIELLVSEEID